LAGSLCWTSQPARLPGRRTLRRGRERRMSPARAAPGGPRPAHRWSNSTMTTRIGPPLFALGRTVATPGALDALASAGVHPAELLARHQRGDWGELSDEDRRENDFSVSRGFRILSS